MRRVGLMNTLARIFKTVSIDANRIRAGLKNKQLAEYFYSSHSAEIS